jgi:hypothetical protein
MHIFAFGTGEQVMMIHLLRTSRLVLVVLMCASCGSSNPWTGPDGGQAENLPQRWVSGWVRDTAFRPIAGAQVAIVGTGPSTVTGTDGSFKLTGGIANAVTLRVAKEGYITQTLALDWPPCPTAPGSTQCLGYTSGLFRYFQLDSLGAVDISGDYTMTLTADSACPDLPSEARSRTYTASIVRKSPGSPSAAILDALTGYRVTVRGDSVVWNPDLDNAGTVVDDFFVKLTFWAFPYFPAVVDQIALNTYVWFKGTATATVTPAPSVISAAFDGQIDYCSLKRPIEDFESCGDSGSLLEPTPSQPVTYASCVSKNHRLVLTRR